jgi:hypothetical protein
VPVKHSQQRALRTSALESSEKPEQTEVPKNHQKREPCQKQLHKEMHQGFNAG